MKEEENICIYYILSSIAIGFFFVWSIANFADTNGWVMLADNAAAGRGAAAFFSFFTALFSTGIYVLVLVNLIWFCRRSSSTLTDD